MCSDYHYITEGFLFDYIQKEVEQVKIKPPFYLREYYDMYIEINLGKDFINQLPDIEKLITKLENRKNGLFNMKADGEMSKEEYIKSKKSVDEELKCLELSRNKIININKEIQNIYKVYDSFIQNIKKFNIYTSDNNGLKKIIKRITINIDKKIKITWNNGLDDDFLDIIKKTDVK